MTIITNDNDNVMTSTMLSGQNNSELSTGGAAKIGSSTRLGSDNNQVIYNYQYTNIITIIIAKKY